MDKNSFIVAINNIANNIQVDESTFEGVMSILKLQGTIPNNYIIDPSKTQCQNLLATISQKTVQFYEIYLGQ
jgi:hypothetical protein